MSEASTVAEAPIDAYEEIDGYPVEDIEPGGSGVQAGDTVTARAVGRPMTEGVATGRQVVTGEALQLPSRYRE